MALRARIEGLTPAFASERGALVTPLARLASHRATAPPPRWTMIALCYAG